MTDIKDRFAGMLADEPPHRDDIERVIASGRRRLRRRTALVTVAGTAGTAAVTAAVVVPLTLEGGGGPSRDVAISIGTQPTTPPCGVYLAMPSSKRNVKKDIAEVVKQWKAKGRAVYTIEHKKLRHGIDQITVCSGPHHGAVKLPDADTASTPASPSAPRYRYTEDPQHISAQFGDELNRVVTTDGLNVVFTRPFAQETSQLESGHPSYFTGNVDVPTGGGDQGDIGVQVRHDVTELVPFDGSCDPPHCIQTKLPDGSVLQTDQVDAGDGTILTAEVHRPDGLVIQAQESNYGFGPNAPVRTYGSQPLTLDQLTAIAEDSVFSF